MTTIFGGLSAASAGTASVAENADANKPTYVYHTVMLGGIHNYVTFTNIARETIKRSSIDWTGTRFLVWVVLRQGKLKRISVGILAKIAHLVPADGDIALLYGAGRDMLSHVDAPNCDWRCQVLKRSAYCFCLVTKA